MRCLVINNESDYKRTIARLTECHLQIVDRKSELRDAGYTEQAAEQKMRELKSICQTLENDIARYERDIANTWVPGVL